MKKAKSGILHWLILAALGLALIIGHNLAQDIIGKILAVGLILSAASGIIGWCKTKSKSPDAMASLLGNILICLVGLWILFNTQRFISLINVVIGVVIILIGAQNLYRGYKLGLKLHMILAVVAIILGIIVVFYNAATSLPVICQGVGLIYTAVVGYLGDRNKK
ncbi:MAG: hypothetical protein IJ157_03515 [Clostridia bacterium]|nr:hypothetical protein [Clostridia bacterium]